MNESDFGSTCYHVNLATKENTWSCVYIILMRKRHLAISLNRLTEKKGYPEVALPDITGCALHSNARREECVTTVIFEVMPDELEILYSNNIY